MESKEFKNDVGWLLNGEAVQGSQVKNEPNGVLNRPIKQVHENTIILKESIIDLTSELDALIVNWNNSLASLASDKNQIDEKIEDLKLQMMEIANAELDPVFVNSIDDRFVGVNVDISKNTADISTTNTELDTLKTDVAQNTATIESQGLVIGSLVSGNETVNTTLQSHTSHINTLLQGNPDLEYSFGPWANRPETTANGNYHFDTDTNKPYWKVDGVWRDASGVEHAEV